MIVERNFLFGLTALRSGLIDARQLAEAGSQWMHEPEQSLAEVLTSRGWLSSSDRSTIEDRVLREMEPPTTSPADGDSDTPGTTIGFRPDPTTERRAGKSGPSARESMPVLNRLRAEGCGGGEDEESGFGPRYRVIRLHATGGIGQVWQVFDRILQREVALKELRPDRARNGYEERRFLEEARITAGLDHPNIVPAYDLSEWGVRPFYTMRFIQGDRTLKDVVHQYHRRLKPPEQGGEPIDLRRLLDHFVMVCNGIDYAHSRGVVHRDLKGQNVVVGSFGETFVLDWGLARRMDSTEDPLARPADGFSLQGDSTLTVDGYPIGTPNYMPPEQARGERSSIGPRSDIFGLGALLYLILTARPVFEGGDSRTVIARAVVGKIEPPSSVSGDVPPALEAICLKALAHEPENRYATARDMADDVRRWLDDEPIAIHPERPLVRVGRWTRKNPAKVASSVAILTTAVLALTLGAWRLGIASREVRQANFEANSARMVAEQDLLDSEAVLRRSIEVMQRDLPAVQDEAADLARLHLAESVVPHYRKLADRHKDNATLQSYIASGLREAAKVFQLMYRLRESESAYREAIEVIDRMKPAPADELAMQDLRLELRVSLAEVIAMRGDPAPAMIVLRDARQRAQQLTTRMPGAAGPLRTEGRVLMAWASAVYQNGDPTAAATYYLESRKRFQGWQASPAVAWGDKAYELMATMGYGASLEKTGNREAAIVEMNMAKQMTDDLLKMTPGHNDALYLLACVQMERARLMPPGEESRRTLEEAHKILQPLAGVRTSVLQYSQTLAAAKHKLAAATPTSSLWDEAQAMLDRVVSTAPDVAQAYSLRASLLLDRARVAIERGNLEAAQRWIDEAARDLNVVTDRNPRNPDDQEAITGLRQAREAINTARAK